MRTGKGKIISVAFLASILMLIGYFIAYRLIYESGRTVEIRAIAGTIRENDSLSSVNDKLERIKNLGGVIDVTKKRDNRYLVTILSAKGYDHYIITIILKE